MPNIPAERRAIGFPVLQKLTGLDPRINPEELELVMHNLSPMLLTRERIIAQCAEAMMIKEDADELQKQLHEKKLPLPSAYGLFTAGFDVPKTANRLGTAGQGIFENFPAPEASGHEGGIYAVDIGEGKIALIMKGRAHPTEWVGERFAPMILAHPLRVVKEMIRRQRTNGVNPPVFLTYLSGVI